MPQVQLDIIYPPKSRSSFVLPPPGLPFTNIFTVPSPPILTIRPSHYSLLVLVLLVLLVLLLQSALQPLWVLALSTAVEYSQQEGFYSGTSKPQPGGPVIRTFQPPPPGVPHA